MPTTIVPVRPGPLREPAPPAAANPPARIIGPPEIGLAVIGAALLVVVALTGLPSWLAIPAVGCLGMGLGLPAQAALSRGRTAGTGGRGGVPIDIGNESARRLVTAYRRIEQTPRNRGTLVTAHRILMEVADHLDGRAPKGLQDVDYIDRHTDAITALTDR